MPSAVELSRQPPAPTARPGAAVAQRGADARRSPAAWAATSAPVIDALVLAPIVMVVHLPAALSHGPRPATAPGPGRPGPGRSRRRHDHRTAATPTRSHRLVTLADRTWGPASRRAARRDGLRPAARPVIEHLDRLGPSGAPGPPGRRRPRHPGHGHHLHRLLRRAGHRPGVAVRRDPPGDRRRPSGGASRPASSSGCGRSTPSSTTSTTTSRSCRRRVPGRAARRRPQLPARVPRRPPGLRAWAHISGCDLVRDADGTFFVLEDNLRVPSGVSYLLENRLVIEAGVRRPVRRPEHPARSTTTPTSCSPAGLAAPDGVIDPTSRAHPRGPQLGLLRARFLAQRMGVALVEGATWSTTTTTSTCARIAGPQPVDVIYRRVDDLFLDPEAFDPDSRARRPGLMRAWRAGQRRHGQRPRRRRGRRQGRLRLGARPHPLLPGRGADPPERAHLPLLYEDERREVLDNLADLVVKPANESGGYGSWSATGPPTTSAAWPPPSRPTHATGWPSRSCRCRRRRRCARARSSPATSTCGPSSSPAPKSYVTRGGLTRVALREGSLVVNSSQGGGSKDTWVIESSRPRGAGGRPCCCPGSPSSSTGPRHLERASRHGPGGGRAHAPAGRHADVWPSRGSPCWPSPGTVELRRAPPVRRRDNIIAFLLADRQTPSSVLSSAVAARENLRAAREALPREAWQALNDLYLYVTSHHPRGSTGEPSRFLDKVVAESQRFDGILAGPMNRDEAYTCCASASTIERADMTTRVLDVRALACWWTSGEADRPACTTPCSGRRCCARCRPCRPTTGGGGAPIHGRLTVDFLLRDPDFPRLDRALPRPWRSCLADLPREGDAAAAAGRQADAPRRGSAPCPRSTMAGRGPARHRRPCTTRSEHVFSPLPDEVAIDPRATAPPAVSARAQARSE